MGGGTDPIALPAGPGNIPVPATGGASLNLKPVAGIRLKGVRLIEMARVQGLATPSVVRCVTCCTSQTGYELNRMLDTPYQCFNRFICQRNI